MKRLFLTGLLAISSLLAANAAQRNEARSGEYVWSHDGDRMPVNLIFTPTNNGEWTVDFHFTIGPNSYTYSGTVEGSLDQGSLSGTVFNETRRRSYRVEGTVVDGSFEGTHSEITRGRLKPTGTLTFGPVFSNAE